MRLTPESTYEVKSAAAAGAATATLPHRSLSCLTDMSLAFPLVTGSELLSSMCVYVLQNLLERLRSNTVLLDPHQAYGCSLWARTQTPGSLEDSLPEAADVCSAVLSRVTSSILPITLG